MAGDIVQETRMPMAQQSPRINDKTKILRWYYKDTFEIDWQITLFDNDSNSVITYGEGDQILVSFYIYGTNKLIYSFPCTVNKEGVKGWIDSDTNTLVLNFDKEVSQRFRPGKYSYSLKYIRGTNPQEQLITTICTGKIVEVEKW